MGILLTWDKLPVIWMRVKTKKFEELSKEETDMFLFAGMVGFELHSGESEE